jgi:GTP cyclohydrolase I
MAYAVLGAVTRRLEQDGRLRGAPQDSFLTADGADFESRDVALVQRPPMASLHKNPAGHDGAQSPDTDPQPPPGADSSSAHATASRAPRASGVEPERVADIERLLPTATRGKTPGHGRAKEYMTTTPVAPHLNGHHRPSHASRRRVWRDGERPIDRAALERAANSLLAAVGADLESDSLRHTPRRMADTYAELLTPEPFDLTTFANDEGYDELIVMRDIPFQSLCMHHVLPFHGVAHIAYLPAERILGLSKLARVVELYARDLQLQERLTTQIAGWLQEQLQPKGVGVVLEAEHLCMSLRGVQKPGAETVTSALHGLVRDDPRTREEFLSLTGRRSR